MTAPLKGMLSTAPDGTMVFDCNAPLSGSQCRAMLADGYAAAIRYVPRVNRASYDLSRNEAELILASGLGVGIVQHVGREGWDASAEKGKLYGATAAAQVLDMGFPKGMQVWCDLEGVDPNDNDPDVIAFCTEWHDAVDEVGLEAGLYVGWRTLLNSNQLYNLPFQHYWSAYNLNRDEFPAVRGVQMKQELQKEAHGVTFDPDIVSADKLGDRCWFFWPQA